MIEFMKILKEQRMVDLILIFDFNFSKMERDKINQILRIRDLTA